MIEQLKADYRLIYKTLRNEGQMRSLVFGVGGVPSRPQRTKKLGEIEAALQALERIKELLKMHLQVDPDRASEAQQPLLELPAERKEYR